MQRLFLLPRAYYKYYYCYKFVPFSSERFPLFLHYLGVILRTLCECIFTSVIIGTTFKLTPSPLSLPSSLLPREDLELSFPIILLKIARVKIFVEEQSLIREFSILHVG